MTPLDWTRHHIDAPQRTWCCLPVPSAARATGVPRDSPAVVCRFWWGTPPRPGPSGLYVHSIRTPCACQPSLLQTRTLLWPRLSRRPPDVWRPFVRFLACDCCQSPRSLGLIAFAAVCKPWVDLVMVWSVPWRCRASPRLRRDAPHMTRYAVPAAASAPDGPELRRWNQTPALDSGRPRNRTAVSRVMLRGRAPSAYSME